MLRADIGDDVDGLLAEFLASDTAIILVLEKMCQSLLHERKAVVLGHRRYAQSQPELGANPVSLRPPNWPKGGPMGFLDIPGLNIAQKSGGKGWNPANGVPFCARAYICRPRPLGLAGWLCDAGEYLGRP